MRLVFAGTPPVAVTALRALAASRHTVEAVITRPDAPAGRGRRVEPSAVAEVAGQLGMETLKPIRPNDPVFQARLREIAPDSCPVLALSFNPGGAPTTVHLNGRAPPVFGISAL